MTRRTGHTNGTLPVRLLLIFGGLSLVAAACSNPTSGSVRCQQEGEQEGNRVCRDGFWVEVDTGVPVVDTLSDTDDSEDGGDDSPPDAADVSFDGVADAADVRRDGDAEDVGEGDADADEIDDADTRETDDADVGEPDDTDVGDDVDGCVSMPESCNGMDDDCDGNVDEEFTLGEECTVGQGACESTGQTVCNEGGSGTTCDAEPGTSSDEVCDDVDNDCDGQVDEEFDLGAECTVGMGACETTGEYVCDADGPDQVCDAEPGDGTTEICGDDIDNDCDGQVDEAEDADNPVTWYEDCDGDGYAAETAATTESCSRPSTSPCGADSSWTDREPTDVATIDCNDDNADISPGAAPDETADSGEGCYKDADGDGWGDEEPGGDADPGSDCDDSDPDQNPDASETCNEEDDDCDGTIDESTGDTTWYVDCDGDTYAAENADSVTSCSEPSGGTGCDGGGSWTDTAPADTTTIDCDDADPDQHPDADEICNGQDYDCDSDVDENVNQGGTAGSQCSYNCDCLGEQCRSGRCAYRVFVTSDRTTGDFGPDVQTYCDDYASNAGLDGTWDAVVSTETDSASARITREPTSNPAAIVNMCGNEMVARGVSLWDVDLTNAPQCTEDAQPLSGTAASGTWTGTEANGSSAGDMCMEGGEAWNTNATGAPPPQGRAGDATSATTNWVFNDKAKCENERRVYCIDGQ